MTLKRLFEEMSAANKFAKKVGAEKPFNIMVQINGLLLRNDKGGAEFDEWHTFKRNLYNEYVKSVVELFAEQELEMDSKDTYVLNGKADGYPIQAIIWVGGPLID